MTNNYKGIIIEESLIDNRILNDLNIVDFRISNNENPEDRWHLYTVLTSYEEIEKLSDIIKLKWYMHFWKGRDIVAVFNGKKFEFNYDDKTSWLPAVEHGIAEGIPREQLDFIID